MLTFECDYTQGAHPEILKRLTQTNFDMQPGYGDDIYTRSAAEKIAAACGGNVTVKFLTGGTQTNAIVIDSLTRSYEGVMCAATGHINGHEAGAIEFTGHKVLPLPQKNGILDAGDVRKYMDAYLADGTAEHIVRPGMVYISHPSEYGTLYTKAQLKALSDVCHSYNIPLYLDGARLGYGLASLGTDVTLRDIAELCDVFYIGGTKVGALCGEALVFTKSNCPEHFLSIVKQHGALMAKGRVIGVQFDTLFTDDLYMKISRNAIEKAEKLKKMFEVRGYKFFLDSPTNQQFVVLDNAKIEELRKSVGFSIWEPVDETHTAVRFATSWATTDDDLASLEKLL